MGDIVFALDAHGKLVSILDVARGEKCGCVCPACGEKVVAKQGEIMAWHFAHAAAHSCEYAGQSTLHLVAKEVLMQRKEIAVPAAAIFRHKGVEQHIIDNRYEKFHAGYSEVGKAAIIKFDTIVAEKKFDSFIPDLIATIGNKKLIIEVFVTHKVDEQKLKKIIASGATGAIEIDLSEIHKRIKKKLRLPLLISEIEELVVNSFANKYWLYSQKANDFIESRSAQLLAVYQEEEKEKEKVARLNHERMVQENENKLRAARIEKDTQSRNLKNKIAEGELFIAQQEATAKAIAAAIEAERIAPIIKQQKQDLVNKIPKDILTNDHVYIIEKSTLFGAELFVNSVLRSYKFKTLI
jgi:hypothetical protein